MALAEFKTTEQAMDFYEQCGPVAKIMGFSSKIFVDTLGFWTTDEYTRLTGEEPPSLPTRRELFKDEEQIRRIRELIRRQNRKGDSFNWQTFNNKLLIHVFRRYSRQSNENSAHGRLPR